MHTNDGINSSGCCGGSKSSAAQGSTGGGCCGGSKAADAQGAESAAGGCCGGGGGGGGGGCCGGGAGMEAQEQVLVFSRSQARSVDQAAANDFGMPTLLLMENAARGVASVVIEGLQGLRGATVCVVCGPGNNGGDGLALARHLSNRGVKVGVVLSGTAGAYTGDARVNMTIVERMGLPVVECAGDAAKALDAIAQAIGEPHLIVDALLGTGADRPATGSIASLINAINTQHEAGVSVLSVDLPSGMDADTGKPCEDDRGVGPCVRADLTVSLAGVKIGFLGAHAQEYAGELVVVDIGVPTQVLERFGTPMNRHAHALG